MQSARGGAPGHGSVRPLDGASSLPAGPRGAEEPRSCKAPLPPQAAAPRARRAWLPGASCQGGWVSSALPRLPDVFPARKSPLRSGRHCLGPPSAYSSPPGALGSPGGPTRGAGTGTRGPVEGSSGAAVRIRRVKAVPGFRHYPPDLGGGPRPNEGCRLIPTGPQVPTVAVSRCHPPSVPGLSDFLFTLLSSFSMGDGGVSQISSNSHDPWKTCVLEHVRMCACTLWGGISLACAHTCMHAHTPLIQQHCVLEIQSLGRSSLSQRAQGVHIRVGENVASIPGILIHRPVFPPEHIFLRFLIHINDLLGSKRKIEGSPGGPAV